jgi:SAM-dependent methyltransferase
LTNAYRGYRVHTQAATDRSRDAIDRLQVISRVLLGVPALRTTALSLVEIAAGRSIPLKYRVPLVMDRGVRVLDIGCGTGHYLSLLNRLGFSSLAGFDIIENPHARQLLPLADLRYAPHIESVGFAPASFDLITLVHTLEHVDAPKSLLNSVRTLLKPGGTLVVEVPDFGGAVAQRSGRGFGHLDVPKHLWHFTRKSLRSICRESGVEVVKVQHIYSADMARASFVGQGDDTVRRRAWLTQRAGFARSLFGSGTELAVCCREPFTRQLLPEAGMNRGPRAAG